MTGDGHPIPECTCSACRQLQIQLSFLARAAHMLYDGRLIFLNSDDPLCRVLTAMLAHAEKRV